MVFFEAAQNFYEALNHSAAWCNFDDFNNITEPCVKEDYEYKYCESRLYVIRHKHERWCWIIKAKSPGDALNKCLARGFWNAGR